MPIGRLLILSHVVPLYEKTNQVQDSLSRLGLSEGLRWSALRQGDRLCTFEAWPEALLQSMPGASSHQVPARETLTAALPTTGSSASLSAFYQTSSGSGSGNMHTSPQLPLAGRSTRAESARPVSLDMNLRRPSSSYHRSQRRPGARRFALLFLSSSNQCLGPSSESEERWELASSEMRARVLRWRGYEAVLAVSMDIWLNMLPDQRDRDLREALASCFPKRDKR